jgi:hypothetical protein
VVVAHGTSRDGIIRRANEKVREGGYGYERASTPRPSHGADNLLSGRLLFGEGRAIGRKR